MAPEEMIAQTTNQVQQKPLLIHPISQPNTSTFHLEEQLDNLNDNNNVTVEILSSNTKIATEVNKSSASKSNETALKQVDSYCMFFKISFRNLFKLLSF